ncbi:MAG: hypothetical protein MI674_07535 [Cytophagales bacterium]|nr:hypothetical protein [Cytophagales bacterium]
MNPFSKDNEQNDFIDIMIPHANLKEPQPPQFGTQNSELGTQNSELRTRNSELGTRNSELGTQNSELRSGLKNFCIMEYS